MQQFLPCDAPSDRPSKARKPKAPTLREADWAPYKPRIVQLHITENIPLKDVRTIMQQETGFNAELRQYRTRLTKWKLDKNIKTTEMKAVVRKSQYRSLVEVDRAGLRFRIREQVVEREKIARWMRGHGVGEFELYAPSSVASTPSAVDYWTVSERSTPVRSVERTHTQTPVPQTPGSPVLQTLFENMVSLAPTTIKPGSVLIDWRSPSPASTRSPSPRICNTPTPRVMAQDLQQQDEVATEDISPFSELSQTLGLIDLDAEDMQEAMEIKSRMGDNLYPSHYALMARRFGSDIRFCGWRCCKCGDALVNYASNDGCLSSDGCSFTCRHWRCTNCTCWGRILYTRCEVNSLRS